MRRAPQPVGPWLLGGTALLVSIAALGVSLLSLRASREAAISAKQDCAPRPGAPLPVPGIEPRAALPGTSVVAAEPPPTVRSAPPLPRDEDRPTGPPEVHTMEPLIFPPDAGR